MKVKVTMETTLEVDKEELAILKQSDATTVVQTATLQGVPVEVSITKKKD